MQIPNSTQSQKRLDDGCWKMLSSPPSSTSLIGHCIGMESCVDLKNDEEIRTAMNDVVVVDGDDDDDHRNSSQRYCSITSKRDRLLKKEFPPTIPWLARTGNLPSHMPWVMKRYHTDDGRLVIREEKVRHHEYFRAHRSNGRLTLQLIPLDDDDGVVSAHQEAEAEADEEEPEEDVKNDHVNVEIENEMMVKDLTAMVVNESAVKIASVIVESTMENGGKCSSMRSTSSAASSSSGCIFGMQVVPPPPPLRPVIS